MKNSPTLHWLHHNSGFLSSLLLLIGCAAAGTASAFTLSVKTPAGAPLANGFRWLVEEDTTTFSLPGAQTTNALSLIVHKSYAPVVTNGVTMNGDDINIDLPGDKRYMVSVLPNEGHQLGGATVSSNQTEVTVICNKHPVPTAQITIRVFEDNDPIDIVIDPTERGLPGFRLVVKELAGGADLQDAFGNPLGTTYQTNAVGFILDVEGNPIVAQLGDGNILTDTNGEATIKNLWPGRFGIEAIAPPGSSWIQTVTLEGGPVQEIRVKANEPPLLSALIPGIPAKHILIGFVDPSRLPWATNPPTGPNTIKGTLLYLHSARPPDFQARNPGPPVPTGLIGLNDQSAPRKGRYVTACNPDGTFTINNVPDGTYEIFNWDRALSSVVGFTEVTVAGGEIKDVGNILALPFFGTLSGNVFYDFDVDGFRDPGEPGIPRQAINLRWRDGSIYQATQSDEEGNYSLNEIFPWFHYLIAEVDYARYKATGATIAVDEGGPIPPADGWTTPSFGALNPQPQLDMDPLSPNWMQPTNNPNTGNNLSKTDLEPAPVLLQGMMLYAGQHNVIDWGKANYQPGDNGGIAGIIYYAVTRAEDDPRYAAGETWEPGIPHVQVALYQDANNDKIIDDLDGTPGVTRADVDNHPFGWRDGGPRGPEDVDHNNNGSFDPGDAVNIAVSDSFDETLPISGAQGTPVTVHGQELVRNYDNLSAWNQVRPAVFDGGYIFLSIFPGGLANNTTTEVSPIPPGNYIVEVTPPPGYELQKEEDKNVDFGDTFTPSALLLPPEVVGTNRLVPTHLTLFPGVECAFGGQIRPYPDRKLVRVANGRNTAADFFLFTAVPKAARAVGWTVNEFAPNPVNFNQRATPAWIPVSFRDWKDNEVARVYTDEFGKFNAMLPSTFTINPPTPSGVSPNAIRLVMNDPTMPDPNNPGLRVIDPYFDPNYDQFFFTYEFLAGKTTYTPMFVAPSGAFVGNPDRSVDAEPPDGTPAISAISAANGVGGGPQVCATNHLLTIVAAGPTQVRNPAAGTTNNEPLLITRDYGFGAVLGQVTVGGLPINILSWSSGTITADVPSGVGSGQLMITRGDNNRTTLVGLTLTVLTVGSCGAGVHHVPSVATPTIQKAIDDATPGDLILVAPGSYAENVIMWKPVRLQGAGSESTLIIGNRSTERVAAWHEKVKSLLSGANPFLESETPGILVLGNAGVPFTQAHNPRIDGFGVTASVLGSGIRVYNEARFLRISNNKLRGCAGFYAGGITLGTLETLEPIHNDFVTIERNLILKNGGKSGGGIAIYHGSKGYVVKDNVISGNFGTLYGAGILHEGLSDGGLIANNTITFNECFVDTLNNGEGGGIFIVGQRLAGALTPGAGSVTISRNLIQGNVASQADGGGINAAAFNGQDVLAAPGDPLQWYALTIINNIIVNNIAAKAGGGLSLRDVCRVFIINNTVANNDSTASAEILFPPGVTVSSPLPAGLVTYAHTPELATASGQSITSPVLEDNIFWHNRSFYYDAAQNGGAGGLLPNSIPTLFYWDLAVDAPAGQLNPTNCILTDATGYPSNIAADPLFVDPYTNVISTGIIQDETGTFIDLNPAPLGPAGNYHIQSTSPAIDVAAGNFIAQIPALALDFDRQTRPGGSPDIGADEYSALTPEDEGSSTPNPGDIIGPLLVITSHANGQVIPGTPVSLSGTATDSGRGEHGISSVTVNGIPATGGTAAGGGTANWSINVLSGLVPGPNTFAITATDASVNSNSTVRFITLYLESLAPAGAIVRLDFDENTGNRTTNSGSAGGLFTLTATRPAWTSNAAPSVGGPSAIDYGTSTGNYGVDSPGVLNGLKNLAQFTITGWLNNRSSSEGSGGNRVVRWLGTTSQGVDLIYHSDGRLDLGVNATPNSTARSSSGRIPTSSSANSNNWRYFAVTYDSTLFSNQVQFFFGTRTNDAVLDVARNYGGRGPAGMNIGTLTIGHLNPPTRANNTSRMFRGLVDEIQIFGRVLSPSDIVAIQRGTTGPGVPRRVSGFPEALTEYPDVDGIDTDGDGNATNDHVVIHLTAGDGFSKMADGRDIYTFGFSDVTGVAPDEIMAVGSLAAEFPAPTIAVKEGQKLFLKLSNVGMMMRPDLFDPHSIHYHGFPNAAPVFDGVPDGSMVIQMGGTFTYFYNNATPGTFIYHCHVEATEHMQMGMLGQLYVLPKQNNLPNGTNLRGFTHQTGFKYAYNDGDGSTLYHVEYPLQISGFDGTFHELHLGIQPLPFALMKDNYPMLNGRGYPDTIKTNAVTNLNGRASQKISSLITATRGQKILLRLTSLATVEFHTVNVLGIPMKVIGKGAALLRGPDPDGAGPGIGKNLYYNTSSVTLGGGEGMDVILDTSAVAAGTYFLYATRLHALSNAEQDYGGIMTEIVIR